MWVNTCRGLAGNCTARTAHWCAQAARNESLSGTIARTKDLVTDRSAQPKVEGLTAPVAGAPKRRMPSDWDAYRHKQRSKITPQFQLNAAALRSLASKHSVPRLARASW